MSSSRSIFEKLDIALSTKKSSEVSLILLMIFVFIGFISYAYVFPITDKKLKYTKRNLNTMEKKVAAEKNYLRSVTRNGDTHYYVNQARKDIEKAKTHLTDTTNMNTYIDNKLKNLSYLLFNNQNWAKFLDSITLLAQKNKVKVKIIENSINKPNLQKIEQILTLKVEFNGKFKNVMKFINEIEESKLVVDIYDLNLKGAAGIDGYVNIAVWGMKY
ncbi:hypothetical protein [Sulfurospirillum sp. 1612]|uniref:hypothetical protein n=1 Tax=Sulfurospirillum sp. 1612 TaxID=3094835 RepID=UPI002F950A44